MATSWCGILTSSLRGGEDTRLDFQDGEYLTLENVLVESHNLVKFDYRLMGIGAATTITWRGAAGDTHSIRHGDGVAPEPFTCVEDDRQGWVDVLTTSR